MEEIIETKPVVPAPKTNWAKVASDNAGKPLRPLPPQPKPPVKSNNKNSGSVEQSGQHRHAKGNREKPQTEKKPTTCKRCLESEAKNEPKICELCMHKGRDTVQNTHCIDCCGFCSYCDRRGHQLYNDDGTFQCFKKATCGICGEEGHNTDFCRRDWCNVCRTDGLGDNYIGHATERCFKRHVCETCNETGHMENRCPTLACKKCGNSRHTTDQCEQDVRCNICDQFGHSAKRCRQCNKCGFSIVKDKPHKCRRNEHNECKECGSSGSGICGCLQYLLPPPRR